MNATIINDPLSKERICVNCDSVFVAGNAKRQYCSANCRVAHHRKKQSQTIHQQEETVSRQATVIQQLTNAPLSRTESVRVVNPAWQLAQQNYDAQKLRCTDLKSQLAALQHKAFELTSGDKGAYLGAGGGIAIVLICMAFRFDARQRKPLGSAFVVVSLVCLTVMGIIGYLTGRQLHRHLLVNNDKIRTKLKGIVCMSDEVDTQVKVETARLNQFHNELSKMPKYESETVTKINETRFSS